MQKGRIIKGAIIIIVIMVNIVVIAILINNIKTNVEKIENGEIANKEELEKRTENEEIKQNNNIKLPIPEIIKIILIIIGLILVNLSCIIMIKCKKLLF